jgi:hypothetical protein
MPGEFFMARGLLNLKRGRSKKKITEKTVQPSQNALHPPTPFVPTIAVHLPSFQENYNQISLSRQNLFAGIPWKVTF